MTLKNIKLLYESLEDFIKLFIDYSPTVSEAKYKTIHGKGIPSISACVACVVRVAKVLDHSNLKTLSPNHMLLAQVKAGNTFENLMNEIRQIEYFLYRAK